MQRDILPLYSNKPVDPKKYLKAGRHVLDAPLLYLVGNALGDRPFLTVRYDVFKHCPYCGEVYSQLEFKTLSYSWPEALSHFIIEHEFKLPRDFRDFLMKVNGQLTQPRSQKAHQWALDILRRKQ